MKIATIAFFVLISILGLIYYLTGYKSAFEADQQCHYFLNNDYSQESSYGCDHDLETRQWILFSAQKDKKPAIVLKRFRY